MLARCSAAVCLGLCAGLGGAAAANAGTIALLSPVMRFTPPPPVYGTTPFRADVRETQFPGRLHNDERVVVELEDDGSARSIVATQRLVISQVGDYSFLVPAPATDVVAAPGSQAEPGLRNIGIVWQGFSPGRRVLAATATLSPEADRGLPLAVSVVRRGDGIAVRLVDVARRQVEFATGSPAPGALEAFLVRLRRTQSSAGPPIGSVVYFVNGTTTGRTATVVTAPLRVRGTLTAPGGAPVRVDTVLGNGRPLEQTIRLAGRALPKIDLRVDLLDPLEILPLPNELAAARDPLSTLQSALGGVALSWQYRHFLDSPDPSGPSSTTYVFRTAERAAALPQPLRHDPGDDDTLAIVLAATLGAAGLLGLVVLWAHL